MSAAARETAADETRARVEPLLRDLMGLASHARSLPAFTRIRRARHSGPYLSRLRGRGMEYDESRPYQPGDDMRQFDWRVTARTGRPHTKLFREERERPVFTCLDCRPSMFFATRGVFKIVLAARLAALVGWRAQQNSDRVGGLIFSAAEHHEIAPGRGQIALVRWLKLICDTARASAAGRGDERFESGKQLLDACVRLRRVAKPGSLVFVVSDFRGYDGACADELARLAVHCDVVLLKLYDSFEARFPAFDEAGALTDGRAVMQLGAVADRERKAYAQRFEAQLEQIKQDCIERRMVFGTIDTTQDPLPTLIRILET